MAHTIQNFRKDVDEQRNERMRTLYNIILEETGTRTTFISRATNVPNPMLNQWKNGTKNFTDMNLDRLELFIEATFPNLYAEHYTHAE